MASITLAYHDEDLSGDLTYAALIAAATAHKTFTPIELFDPEKEHMTHTPSITGRGRKIEQILHSYYNYPMKIEPRELFEDSTKLPFLRNLWDADYIYLSYYDYDGSNWGDFVEVIRNGKNFPIDYERNLKYLPFVEFNFSGVESVL
jgi:hypothetical protein